MLYLTSPSIISHFFLLELKKTKLCFSHPTTCECQSSTDINVINCGKFFIYKRNDFPLGQSRACTVPQDAGM